jgi:class 3 adenylate cyclase
VGITTGKVFCGEAGCDVRREYTLSGDRVNLAARLMQAAEKELGPDGGVIVDQETHAIAHLSLSDDECAFELLEPMKVKGKAQPVTVYRAFVPLSGKVKTRLLGVQVRLT